MCPATMTGTLRACGFNSRSAYHQKWHKTTLLFFTLWERTTLTGNPFWQEMSNALLLLSNFWSNDCSCSNSTQYFSLLQALMLLLRKTRLSSGVSPHFIESGVSVHVIHMFCSSKTLVTPNMRAAVHHCIFIPHALRHTGLWTQLVPALAVRISESHQERASCTGKTAIRDEAPCLCACCHSGHGRHFRYTRTTRLHPCHPHTCIAESKRIVHGFHVYACKL